MDIKDIYAEKDLQKRIKLLSSQRQVSKEVIDEAKNCLDPYKHEVFNRAKRPMRDVVEKYTTADGSVNERVTQKEVNRLGIPLQKIIIERAVAFLFGNPVSISIASDEVQAEDVLSALRKIGKEVKIDSFNRRVARTLFSVTEVAECWYTIEGYKSNRYGFYSPLKVRAKIFSPLKGDTLLPFFNKHGDMVAFSRAFTKQNIDGKNIDYFETWTDDFYTRLAKVDNWYVEEHKPNIIGKIPIVYAKQEQVEYYNVQSLINRVENILSNNADINDRHSTPILAVKGNVDSKIGDVVEIGRDGDIHYISWNQSTQNVDLEVKTLLSLIYSLTQTPDISFESVKGLGNATSGEGLKMLFLDAHLKVQNKLEIFDEYLTRRYNILKAILAKMNTAWAPAVANMEVDIRVTPFMLNSESGILDNIIQAYQSGLLSQKSAVGLNPYVEDAEREFISINEEKKARNASPFELDDRQNEDV